MSKEQIETYLRMQTNLVRRNATIVSTEELGQNYMLHISHDNMSGKKYQPWIGMRQANNEDRTVPRITVSPYLVGCIYGFASALHSFVSYGKKGVFYIHKIPFEHCLKPTARLVYDADLTDEHWLVRYNNQTTFYYPELVGKFILSGVELDLDSKKDVLSDHVVRVYIDQVTQEFNILPGVVCPIGKSELEFQYDTYASELIKNKQYKLRKSNKQISLENQLNNIIFNW